MPILHFFSWSITPFCGEFYSLCSNASIIIWLFQKFENCIWKSYLINRSMRKKREKKQKQKQKQKQNMLVRLGESQTIPDSVPDCWVSWCSWQVGPTVPPWVKSSFTNNQFSLDLLYQGPVDYTMYWNILSIQNVSSNLLERCSSWDSFSKEIFKNWFSPSFISFNKSSWY